MDSQITQFITHSQKDNKTSNKDISYTPGEQLRAPVAGWAAQKGYVEMRKGEMAEYPPAHAGIAPTAVR